MTTDLPAIVDAHPDDCDCATTCRPYRLAAASVAEASNAVALQCSAGIALGLLLSWGADLLLDGPGLFGMIGL